MMWLISEEDRDMMCMLCIHEGLFWQGYSVTLAFSLLLR